MIISSLPAKLHINVTQDHIDNGVKDNCKQCPVALAIIEQYPDSKMVKVFPDYIKIDTNYYNVQESLSDFVFDFDMEEPEKPFAFVAERW